MTRLVVVDVTSLRGLWRIVRPTAALSVSIGGGFTATLAQVGSDRASPLTLVFAACVNLFGSGVAWAKELAASAYVGPSLTTLRVASVLCGADRCASLLLVACSVAVPLGRAARDLSPRLVVGPLLDGVVAVCVAAGC